MLGAALCGAAAVLVWVLSFHVEALHRIDAKAFMGFTGLNGVRGTGIAPELAGLADPPVFALLGGAVILLALLRGRLGTAVVIATVLLGANVTTQALKLVLDHSRGTGLGEISWPSGHTTAAMTVALCLVLASPVRWRPYAGAIGSVYVLAVAFSLMILGWHFPSDVVGGMFIASAWMGAAVAVQQWLAARRSAHAPRRALRAGDAVRPVLLTAAGLAAVGASALLARAEALSYLVEHTAFTTGAALTAALALGLLGAASLVLTR